LAEAHQEGPPPPELPLGPPPLEPPPPWPLQAYDSSSPLLFRWPPPLEGPPPLEPPPLEAAFDSSSPLLFRSSQIPSPSPPRKTYRLGEAQEVLQVVSQAELQKAQEVLQEMP